MELECSGIRDKTKFIPIKEMTSTDFMSDYSFLEECTRYVADRKRDQFKRYTRYNKALPTHLFKLRCGASDRKITLRFLLPIFSKHTTNTTFYDWKSKVIHWRIEWIFINASNLMFVDERCNEQIKLGQLVNKYMATNDPNQSELIRKSLEYYQARGVSKVRLLLKAEGIKNSKTRFFDLDIEKTLNENLAGKTIVEYPIIYVAYDDIASDEFDIIDSGKSMFVFNLILRNYYFTINYTSTLQNSSTQKKY